MQAIPASRRDISLTAVLIGLAGVMSGCASALFLYLLDAVTTFRERHSFIVYALPLGGFVLGHVYEKMGKPIAGGSELVVTRRAEGGPMIPLRLAPMVLFGTLLTHLFGGSAGREGTGVQMGASLADSIFHKLRIDGSLRQYVLAAGIASGFGSVFGVPLAGAIFAIELVRGGAREWRLLPATLVAAFIGDRVTIALGAHHASYPKVAAVAITFTLVAQWVLIGSTIGIVALGFIEGIGRIKKFSILTVKRLPFRLAIGGVLIVVAWRLVGSNDYLGIGTSGIGRAFTEPQGPSVFAWKIAFTAITLGTGFIGGEVTPLFFIGATLGSALAHQLGLPIELGAGVGLAAMFGSAAKAPIALTVMAVELMGPAIFPHALLATAVATLVSARRSIYRPTA